MINDKLMECLTNPIKNKLLMAINEQGRATTKDLAQIADQLPQTTLYRYLKKMVADGLITVVEENRIRNVNEKVYGIAIDFDDEIRKISEDTSREAFIAQFRHFNNGLLEEFQKHLPEDAVNAVRDGYGFYIEPLHATDDEIKELIQKIREVVEPYWENPLTDDRQLRNFAMVITPPVT